MVCTKTTCIAALAASWLIAVWSIVPGEAATSGGPPGAAGTPPSGATIDPGAQVLLNELKMALAHLNSFSATVTTITRYPNDTGHPNVHDLPLLTPRDGRWDLTFQRPNRFKAAPVPNDDTQLLSDGVHLYLSTPSEDKPYRAMDAVADPDARGPKTGQPDDGKPYQTLDAPADLDAVISIVGQAENGLEDTAGCFNRNHPLGLSMNSWLTLTRGPSTQIDGAPVDVLIAAWKPIGQSRSKQYYALDHHDHLVRRETTVHWSPVLMDLNSIKTTTLSHVRVNPALDANTFTFVPPADPVDPEAQDILNKMTAAYTALNSFSAAMRTQASADFFTVVSQGTLAARRPNLLCATNVVDGRARRSVCDGAHFFFLQTVEKGEVYYQEWPAPKGLDQMVILGSGLSVPLPLFKKGDPLNFSALRSELKSLKVGAPGEAQGVPVENLKGIMKPRTPDGGVISIAVGRDDHLLRRITIPLVGAKGTITTTFWDVRVNPFLPLSTFHFTPPPAGKLVAPNHVPPQGAIR